MFDIMARVGSGRAAVFAVWMMRFGIWLEGLGLQFGMRNVSVESAREASTPALMLTASKVSSPHEALRSKSEYTLRVIVATVDQLCRERA